MTRSLVDYSSMRALVAISNKQLAEYIWHFLMQKGARNVQVVYHSKEAIARAQNLIFTHFFIGHHLEDVGGPEFASFIRMLDGDVAEAPILMVMSAPDPKKVMESRDAGVSEIMGVPVTGNLIEARLKYMVAKPKQFIRCNTFIGPDRRRFIATDYDGIERRIAGVGAIDHQEQAAG